MNFKTLAADTLAVAVVTTPAQGTVETWTVTRTPSDTAGTASLAATAPYDVRCDASTSNPDALPEICHVTATNPGAKTVTLTRGYAGTAPLTHLVGATLTMIVTGEALNGPPNVHAGTHAAGGTDPVTLTEAQVTNLTSDLAAKAPLASPALTGTPTSPTAAPGTNTTQLATTAFVAAQGAAAIPESQVTNLVSDLAAKAPLASPALTGTPTAPTPAGGTNTTQLATTAFVQSAVGGAVPAHHTTHESGGSDQVTLTEAQITNLVSDLAAKAAVAGRTTFSNANYGAVAADKYIAQIGTLSASRTVTLPAANAVSAGYMLFVADESNTVSGTNTIVIARAGADTINGATSFTLAQAFKVVRLVSDGTSKWVADLIFAPTIVDFTANGTTVIPAGCSTVTMIAVGAGGGGGAGRRGAAATVRGGGGGGGGGCVDMMTYQAADLGGVGTTLTVVVGAGGPGAPAIAVDSTSGTAGTAGGDSTVKVGALWYIGILNAGLGGGGGTTTGGAGGTDNNVQTYAGGFGGAGGTGVAGAQGSLGTMAAAGGGGGGGISAADAQFGGASGGGGARALTSLSSGSNPGAAGGTNGGNAPAIQAGIPGGCGGGGGGANLTGAGGNGGNGVRGGGGGGGGASVNGFNSGAGGTGGDGWVRIIYQ